MFPFKFKRNRQAFNASLYITLFAFFLKILFDFSNNSSDFNQSYLLSFLYFFILFLVIRFTLDIYIRLYIKNEEQSISEINVLKDQANYRREFLGNISHELKTYNIDINAVAPGPLNTNMLKEVLKAGPSKVGRKMYKKSLDQKKSGGSSFYKVTNLILFLSSKKSDGISGKLISALWDNWENWPNFKKILKTKDIYTLRRIIGRDRGYRWGDK